MHHYTITINPDETLYQDPQFCHVEDTIMWTNRSGKEDTVTLPGCVRPQDGPVTLPDGASTHQYEVVKKGRFGYRHEHLQGTHPARRHHEHRKRQDLNGTSGTIDVS